MRNIIVYHATVAILLGIIPSLTAVSVNYSGSKDGFAKKTGFDSSYNGYLSEYAGQLSGGKALGELHGYGESSQLAPEDGSHFDDGESHNFSESFGEQNDSESPFDSYSDRFESLKFPHQDIETHHYSGGVSSDVESHRNHHKHHFESHHNYQFDEPEKSSEFKGFHSFEGDQIVPYSGGSDKVEESEEKPPQYSVSYEHSEENEVSKAPAKSYEVQSPAPVKSYEANEKVPSSSYHYSYETSKAPSASLGHFYEASKPAKPSASSYSHFYDGSKSTKSLKVHSYESPKNPQASSSLYSSHSFESSKSPSLPSSHEPSLGSFRIKYQHASHQEEPPKDEVIFKFKSSPQKEYHSPLQKNIMTINHGKGGYSFSSLYRS